ncbi:MAG: stage II sporulation protein M [Candidatus Limnocylindria bacterium]
MPARSIDRFVEDRRARWSRLAALVSDARGRVDRLPADSLLELGHLYRAATSDLAIARRDYPHDAVAERLNDLVAAAHALVYSEAPSSGRRLRRYFAREIPATVRADLRYTLAAAALLFVPWLVTWAATLIEPQLAAAAMSKEAREYLAGRTPGSEIPSEVRPVAGPLIIVNNVRVAVSAFAGGATAGVLTIIVLVFNGAVLGTTFGLMQLDGAAGHLGTFILAHGPLELSAIVLSGGAGLRVGWAMLRPGDLSRGDALRLAGIGAIRVVMLVVVVLGAAGVVEAFVSPTSLPAAVKAAVGLVTGGALWAYLLLAGRPRRERQGPLVEVTEDLKAAAPPS